jgi:hypothetical protein
MRSAGILNKFRNSTDYGWLSPIKRLALDRELPSLGAQRACMFETVRDHAFARFLL